MKKKNAGILKIRDEENRVMILVMLTYLSAFAKIILNIAKRLDRYFDTIIYVVYKYEDNSLEYLIKDIEYTSFVEILARVIEENSIYVLIAIMISVALQCSLDKNIRLNEFYMSLPVKKDIKIKQRIKVGCIGCITAYLVLFAVVILLWRRTINVEKMLSISIFYEPIMANDSIINVIAILVYLFVFIMMSYLLSILVYQLVNKYGLSIVTNIMLFMTGGTLINMISKVTNINKKALICDAFELGIYDDITYEIGNEKVRLMAIRWEYIIGLVFMMVFIVIGMCVLKQVIRERDGISMSGLFYSKYAHFIYRCLVALSATFIVLKLSGDIKVITEFIVILAIILATSASEIICNRILIRR